MNGREFDIIVVGAGHAGCEAAAAAANLGAKVLLITMNMQTIGLMSCNPAMGGIAKGQIVREIDALGGYSGIVSDASAIQFRMLNRSKGPAMFSPRTQNDRTVFALTWRSVLEGIPNVQFWQDSVTDLLLSSDKKKVRGVRTGMGLDFEAAAVVLTNGTFLNGMIHVGEKSTQGGRSGEASSTGISETLLKAGFETGRMKTGTPPRLDGRSINYSKMEVQEGDSSPGKFSFLPKTSPLCDDNGAATQKPCFITYTSEKVHDILRTGFDRSPMFAGRIKGIGPRYCPSVEDKIQRFAERDRHQLFVEPEGRDTVEVYLNGFSTSLPYEVQIAALRQVAGLEEVKMFRPGYAIEYDFFPPTQLKPTLETQRIDSLYFAGQINGTTGYEEAACQGLMAGINSVLKWRGDPPFILNRHEAYIGVLIDDLVHKGTDEPYRMFTSRSEFRLLLRQDNADIRLTPLGRKIGLASEERMQRVESKQKEVEKIVKYFRIGSADPALINPILEKLGSSLIRQKVKYLSLLLRPELSMKDFLNLEDFKEMGFDNQEFEFLDEAEIIMKYEGYLEREKEHAQKMMDLESYKIWEDFKYEKVESLSTEGREKLMRSKPFTLGQASRIPGVSPSDISILMIYMSA